VWRGLTKNCRGSGAAKAIGCVMSKTIGCPRGEGDWPLLSVIVPSFNHARFLPYTLDSIFMQEYRPLQVIVADGGSTDGTVKLLQRYAERYPELEWISETDEGPADAVNKGLARAKGEIIGIQSSDDIYYPEAFAIVAREFIENTQVGFVYGDVDGIDEAGAHLYSRKIPEFSWEAFFGVSLAIPQGSIFFRKSVSDRVGGWNGRYYSCDIDYWMRLLFHTSAIHVGKPISAWRRYPEQRTRPEIAKRLWDDYWLMIDESPEIAAADARVRRLARASRHILAMRFPPRNSRLLVWRHLLTAAVLHPGFWRYNPRSVYLRWVPGFKSLRSAVSRIKRIFPPVTKAI
jgi:glycosyltransferase involved in cell wall biosynthesis